MSTAEYHLLEFLEDKNFVNVNDIFKGLRFDHDESAVKRALWVMRGKEFIEIESEGSIDYRITDAGKDLLHRARRDAENEHSTREEEKSAQRELRALQAEALVYQQSIRKLEKDLKEEQLKGVKVQVRYQWFVVIATIFSAIVTYRATIAGYSDRLIHTLSKWLSMSQ